MQKIIALFISATAMLFGAEPGKPVDLTPRATDNNSARVCGADLDKVKAQFGFTRRVVLKGGEIMKNMQFCQGGRLQVSFSRYRVVVPVGEEVVIWTKPEGGTRNVIEGCVNQNDLETPIPPQAPAKPVPAIPGLVPLGLGPRPDLSLTPWTPKPIAEPQKSVLEHKCPTCVAIKSNYLLSTMNAKSGPATVWADVQGGEVKDGVWTVDGKEFAKGLVFTLTAEQLYKFVNGAQGEHWLRFVGKDAEGHEVACGEKGTVLTLVKPKKGRGWFWKLPLIHCGYAFGHDIKKWKGWNLVEKEVCALEAEALWLFLPAGGGVAATIAKPPVVGISPP